jgi:hypothetical protein
LVVTLAMFFPRTVCIVIETLWTVSCIVLKDPRKACKDLGPIIVYALGPLVAWATVVVLHLAYEGEWNERWHSTAHLYLDCKNKAFRRSATPVNCTDAELWYEWMQENPYTDMVLWHLDESLNKNVWVGLLWATSGLRAGAMWFFSSVSCLLATAIGMLAGFTASFFGRVASEAFKAWWMG